MNSHNPPPCSGQEETLYLFLDGELSQAEREEFMIHLQMCPTCQAQLAELQTLFTELASLAEVTAPSELAAQVMAKLPTPAAGPRRLSLGQGILMGQVAIGLSLILLTYPFLVATFNQPLIGQPWLTLYEMGSSLAHWQVELFDYLIALLQARWLFTETLSGFRLSPGLGPAVVASVSLLAWLIGYGVLLYRSSSSFKNGGAS